MPLVRCMIKEIFEMKKMLKITKFAYFYIAGLLLFSTVAFAYIDPSAVTYVIQAVAGAVIALGALITVFRHKIFAFFEKGKKDEVKKELHVIEDESQASNI